MARLNALTTLRKAQYFLEQASNAEFDPNILADPDWLPFAANLEAAIIYACSAVDHLSNELAAIYNSRGYRRWHDDNWDALCESSPICGRLDARRNSIVHQEPEKTHAHVFLEAVGIGIASSMSVMSTVIRANGTVEKANSEKPTEVPEKPKAPSVYVTPPETPKASSPRRRQQFFFADVPLGGRSPPWTMSVSSLIQFESLFPMLRPSFTPRPPRKMAQ
jgi:hypothetical protein